MGIFVGTHERTGASVLITETGAIRGGRLQRVPSGTEWDWAFASKCRGLPWNFAAPHDAGGSEAPAGDGVAYGGTGMGSGPAVQPAPVQRDQGLGPPSAVFKNVTRELINRYGPTDQCPACSEIFLGARRVSTAHDWRCRERIRGMMRQEARPDTRGAKRERARVN